MRGFLILHTIGAGGPEVLEQAFLRRLQTWKSSLVHDATVDYSHDAFRCLLFTLNSVSCRMNQRLRSAAGTQGPLFLVGPRVGLLPADAFAAPIPMDPEAATRRQDLIAQGMETAVAFQADPADGSLLVKTDLLNSTYVYTAIVGRLRVFSNCSSILAKLLGARLRPESAAEFLATGSIYGQFSIYEGLTTLKPARAYRFDREGRAVDREYWTIPETRFETLGAGEAAEAILKFLDEDFARLHDTDKCVLDLTAGFDSRCNLGLALRNGLKVTSIVSGRPDDEDVVFSRRIAAHYGIEHRLAAPLSDDPAEMEKWTSLAAGYTDCEYDIAEYGNILGIHTKHYHPGEISVHGSTADVMRNYFLDPAFCNGNPEGALKVDALIAKKFPRPRAVAESLAPGLLPDWQGHMAGRIAAYDAPSLPAFARLDNIYLRIRMQFWQGRIASSTNRWHASFTPWTSLPVLDAILSTRWREKRGGRLSRILLTRIHPGLDRFPISGGGVPGVGLMPQLVTAPTRAAFVARKVMQRITRKIAKPAPVGGFLEDALRKRCDLLEGIVKVDVIGALEKGAPPAGLRESRLLARLYTLALARERLAA